MESLSSHNIMVMFLSLGILLGSAWIFGELAQRLRQPAVVGEILAGIILGPTVFGALAPDLARLVFPTAGINAVILDAIALLAIVMFLLVAGMEANLSVIWRQGSVGLKVGGAAMTVPFVCGFAAAWLAPGIFDRQPGVDPFIFSLFTATVLSVCGVSIIARILMELNLYRSDLGMVVLSAAIFNDLVGWIVFAVLVGLMKGAADQAGQIVFIIGLTLIFTAGMLTVGRRVIHHLLPLLQAYTRFPGGALSFSLILALIGASFTAWIGVHAIFGSFIVGVAIGDSSHLRENTRMIIKQFVWFIFAPLFFASIGLRVDFFTHFNTALVLIVLLIACVCKMAGAFLGALWGRMFIRDARTVGIAMNSRGAMAVVLGLFALNAGIISVELFVALVVMSLVTSMITGPAIRLTLRQVKKRQLCDALSSRLFIRNLKALARREAIAEIVEKASTAHGLDPIEVGDAVWSREETLPTGIGNGVALPHARIKGLRHPLVAVGISQSGIDFDAPDDKPANVIFLILTPVDDAGAQLEIASEIARLFRNANMLDHALGAENFTDFMALLKNETAEDGRHLKCEM